MPLWKMIPRRLLWKIGLKAFVVRDQDAWRGGPLKVKLPAGRSQKVTPGRPGLRKKRP